MLSFARSILSSCRTAVPPTRPQRIAAPSPLFGLNFARFRTQLAPQNVRYIRRHKGHWTLPTGGSTKGTTLSIGEWGIRIKGDGKRISAKQLLAAEDVLKRKLKPLKGAKVYMRVFPDIPVCVKGNETRMGKGKGSFEFWATRYDGVFRRTKL
ncbi:hypothetical protein EIP86_005197 [Pleurotus ostreatoroseus]|nr:hypothetical protein EIP86_005197 [Pleurotus ostreatoroseus]